MKTNISTQNTEDFLDKKKLNNKKKVTTLGPVLNLEEHVKPDWWKDIFNSIYLKTDGDVVNDSNITSNEIDLFTNIMTLNPDARILDLCCGHGRHSLELARRNFKNVEGLDSSHYLIQKARSNAKKEGLSVKFKEGGARKLPFDTDTFDAVFILGNSFGYFETIEDDLRVLKEVFRVIKPRGRLLIDVTDGTYLKKNFQSRSWEWIDKKLFVCRERSLSIDEQKLISREVVTHVEKGVVADQFYSERLYSEESIKKLLLAGGFSNITFYGNLITNSIRNQDLGMMEKRIILTSDVIKDWTVKPKKTKNKTKNVVVLLGDPGKKDNIKPESVFDDDDFYTIDRLKDALNEIQGYDFKFINNHPTLISDLIKTKSKINYVFNLCDEGFNNNARKELHIPALLEMLDIRYTGAGPQCLAFCYDKSLVRGIAKEMEIPVPDAFFIKPEDTIYDLPIPFPVIVKPNYGDSSFGITTKSVANNIEQLVEAIISIREKLGYDKPILVEKFLQGREISVGIIGNPPENYKILPIIEEDYSQLPPDLPKICGYEAKWLPDSPYWKSLKSIPANFTENVEKKIIECCIKLFERLECRDYCRFDWRFDINNNPKLLEVNPNPGWCWDGHMAKMSKIGDISYTSMIKQILSTAEERFNLKTNLTGE